MTKQEFIEKTKINITDEEYADVERIYMAAGNDLDKDLFCKLYKGLNQQGYDLAAWLTSAVEAKEKNIEKLQQELGVFNEEKFAIAEFLIGKAHAYEDTDCHKQAVKLIGRRAVALMTIKLGLPLFEADIKYINDNLK